MSQKFKQSGEMHRWSPWVVVIVSALLVSLPLMAAILPEDRADALYHSYNGGGADINGPSLMARKQIGQHFSFWGNYFVDSISSATVDVMLLASPYTDKRTQYSVGGDYLNQNSTVSFSYTNSEESDYSADTYSFDISQNLFGDLSTVSIGFSRGLNDVRRNIYADSGTPDKHRVASEPVGTADRWNYRLNWSQILTKNLIVDLGYEAVIDEGYLASPYRDVAIANPDLKDLPDDSRNVIFFAEDEHFPKARNSNTISIAGKYYLPWRASLSGEYHIFSDSWGVNANMYKVSFTQPIWKRFTLDLRYRAYSQTAASFYSNLYDSVKVYMSRHKELSTFNDVSMGYTLSYNFMRKGWWIFDKGSLNLSYDRIQFNYDDFLYEKSTNSNVANWNSKNPYSFSTDVYQFYMSVWY